LVFILGFKNNKVCSKTKLALSTLAPDRVRLYMWYEY